jgi:HSP20 family protein
LRAVPSRRDLFVSFERVRPRAGFSPPVDVYYADDPPTAVVSVEVAGADPDSLGLEVKGRELVVSGVRRAGQAEGRLYQQLEIAYGPFRRAVSLGADVDPEGARATYDDGILRVELPLVARDPRARSVPIEQHPDRP